ncbi:hypothetical protein KCP70_06510 [Salmonella enterica subsp. enterica]|nr:hypothetical protein KCP70_06510 [Salmonella enterica subsp. enterica]
MRIGPDWCPFTLERRHVTAGLLDCNPMANRYMPQRGRPLPATASTAPPGLNSINFGGCGAIIGTAVLTVGGGAS